MLCIIKALAPLNQHLNVEYFREEELSYYFKATMQ